MSRYQQSSGGTGGVAAPSRRDDRSGLLDIRALSSIIDAQRSGGPSASSVALPVFGTPWGLQEVEAAPEPRAAARTVVVGPSDRPLYVMIAALSVAVASLGAYVLMRPTPTVVVERTAVVAGAAVDGEDAEREAEAEAAAKAEAEAEAEAKEKAAALAAAEATEEPADASEPEAKAGAETASVRARGPRASKPSTPSKTVPKAEPEPERASAISVECVIDPSKCDTKGKPKPRVDEPREEPVSAKGLPPAPTSLQIRDAMAPVKPQAKACAARHGGGPGEKVRIKLSVSGSTGKVTSAQALDDHAGTPLGKCVADALSKAELPKFGKPQAGVVYAVTL